MHHTGIARHPDGAAIPHRTHCTAGLGISVVCIHHTRQCRRISRQQTLPDRQILYQGQDMALCRLELSPFSVCRRCSTVIPGYYGNFQDRRWIDSIPSSGLWNAGLTACLLLGTGCIDDPGLLGSRYVRRMAPGCLQV